MDFVFRVQEIWNKIANSYPDIHITYSFTRIKDKIVIEIESKKYCASIEAFNNHNQVDLTILDISTKATNTVYLGNCSESNLEKHMKELLDKIKEN